MRTDHSLVLFGSLIFWGAAGAAGTIRAEVPKHSAQVAEGMLMVEVRGPSGPLMGALVRSNGRSALTDERGQARLTLSAGDRNVSVSMEGFEGASVPATIIAGETTRISIDLSPQITREDVVVVSAARTERRVQDEPVRVEVIDREEIEEKALMTPGSVAMLLGETTGLRVQTTSPSLGAANVRIQGLRGRYSLLLSDGLPLYGVQGDSLSLLQVPPLDLGRVEIIKGAASALYGPSALGGVINLVSQSPSIRQRQLLVNRSSQAATDLTFWLVEPRRGKIAYTMLGGFHHQDRRNLDGDGWADLPSYARGILRPRIFWKNDKGDSIFATAGIMAEDRRGGTIGEAKTPDGLSFPQALDSRRFDAGSVAHFTLGSNLLLSLRASFAHRNDRRTFGDALERGRRSTGFGEAVIQGQAGRHIWLVGGALQHDRFRAREPRGFDYKFVTPGIFAQDEIALSPKATLGLSARLDHHNRYGTFASPRVSLLYKPAPAWNARLSAGTGFFAPTPFIEETEEVGLSRLAPLFGLEAERARSASLDIGWGQGRIEVNATIFGSHVRHPIEKRSVDTRGIALANSEGPVRTWGTELLMRYRVEGFTLLATHGYTRATEEDPESAARRGVPLTPANLASLNAIWEGESWGRFGLEFYYTGRQPLEENPYRARGRGYLLFGALFERRLGMVRLFINLENIGNIRQTKYEPLVRRSRAPDGRWTVDAWSPLEGFVLNGGFRVMF